MAYQQASENLILHRFTGKERIECANWVIQVRDAYNLGYAYTMIHDWVMEEDWASRDDSFFNETYFMQRDHPKYGKEIWLRWRLDKMPGGAKGGLFSYVLDLDWKIIGLKDTEIAWKGQKIKAQRGEFELTCRAAILVDKSKQWTTWPFKEIKEFFTKRVLRESIDMHRKEVYNDAYRLRDLVQTYLKLETFMPMKESGEFYLKRTLE